jgi:hypothetical protein
MKRTLLAGVVTVLLFGSIAMAAPSSEQVVNIPEPSILVMLGLGLFGLSRQARNRTIEIAPSYVTRQIETKRNLRALVRETR